MSYKYFRIFVQFFVCVLISSLHVYAILRSQSRGKNRNLLKKIIGLVIKHAMLAFTNISKNI